MGRIINTKTTPSLKLVLTTSFRDGGKSEVVLSPDDMVEGFRYVKDGEVITVDGRISGFTWKYFAKTHNYSTPSKAKSYFATDVIAQEIIIDSSEQYHSNLAVIPCKEIVEKAGDVDVKQMNYHLLFATTLEVTLSSEEEGLAETAVYNVAEGDEVVDLTYLYRGKELTISGTLVAITVNTQELNAVEFVVRSGNTVAVIPVVAVKSIGNIVEPIEAGSSISDAIADSETGIVSLESGKYEDPIVVSKDAVILGAGKGESGLKRFEMRTIEETVISGKITTAAGVSLTLDGVTLSGDAYLNVAGAKEVTLKNVIIKGLVPDGYKSYAFKNAAADETKLVVEHCAFEDNVQNGTGSVYNFFEINSALLDGSKITGCHFSEHCAEHNDVNIYQVADGANIEISGTVWDRSSNGIRLGIKGDVTATVDIHDCRYVKTDEEYPEYAGLLLVQPYGKVTTSMANLTVKLTNIKHDDDLQLYYLYAGANDMKFTEYNVPTIIVDGETEVSPTPVNPDPEPTPEPVVQDGDGEVDDDF